MRVRLITALPIIAALVVMLTAVAVGDLIGVGTWIGVGTRTSAPALAASTVDPFSMMTSATDLLTSHYDDYSLMFR